MFAISGPVCGGKSTLALKIKQEFCGKAEPEAPRWSKKVERFHYCQFQLSYIQQDKWMKDGQGKPVDFSHGRDCVDQAGLLKTLKDEKTDK